MPTDAEIACRGDPSLHLQVWVYNNYIKWAMVDDGAEVNIVPFSFLQKLGYGETNCSTTRNTLRGYDSLKATSIGTIILSVTLGPKTILTEFYIIDRETNYNMILGRPWIHRMKAIPSTLFQEVRFLHLGKVFVANGDPKPFDLHLANLKKKPGVHSEFELPTNQLNKPTDPKPEEKLVPTKDLEPISITKTTPTPKDKAKETVSLGNTTKIVELIEQDSPMFLPFDSSGIGYSLGVGSLPVEDLCMVEVECANTADAPTSILPAKYWTLHFDGAKFCYGEGA
ncbi:hypothetical protein KI387_011432, partial [Taxus chinensis]